MTEQLKNTAGSSAGNPSRLRRWLSSQVIRRLSNPQRRQLQRQASEQQRAARGEPHRVEYFHQVEDPYSYLVAQLLQPLLSTYNIELAPQLVRGPEGNSNPEPDLLLRYAQSDCEVLAPHYGLVFPVGARPPNQQQIVRARRILAAAPGSEFPQRAVSVGRALWSSETGALETLAAEPGQAEPERAQQCVEEGTRRRAELGHYSGAMLYYGGEWYWGVDRLYHLETRLLELGVRHGSGHRLLLPRPDIETGVLRDNGSLTLEIYPSLRSPYTAIIFDKTVSLARHTGVNLIVKPVLPMVMRNVPVSLVKGRYIAFDAAREAETLGVEFGKACDPVGRPVRQAYSLYPWAQRQGRGIALLSAFLRLAWAQGVNTNRRGGLRKVVEVAGLDWKEARAQLDPDGASWQQYVEQNRQSMYAQGIWGVPAFRLLNREGEVLLTTWGQDRLWLVARTIRENLRHRQG